KPGPAGRTAREPPAAPGLRTLHRGALALRLRLALRGLAAGVGRLAALILRLVLERLALAERRLVLALDALHRDLVGRLGVVLRRSTLHLAHLAAGGGVVGRIAAERERARAQRRHEEDRTHVPGSSRAHPRVIRGLLPGRARGMPGAHGALRAPLRQS